MPTRKRTSRWERSTVWAVLRNPAYKGTGCFGKTKISHRQRVTRPLRMRGGSPSATAERYWLRMLRSRSWASRHLTWEAFNQIKQRSPLLRPKLRLPYRSCRRSRCCESTAEEPGAGNLHAGFCGNGGAGDRLP